MKAAHRKETGHAGLYGKRPTVGEWCGLPAAVLQQKGASVKATLAPPCSVPLLEIQAQDKLNLAVGSRAHSPGHSLVKLPEAATSARGGS